MEGLRGLAVVLVFLVHYSDLVMPWVEDSGPVALLARRVGDAGNIGVDLFFVLSGFLIYGGLMRREQAWRPFVRRRLRRLYPTFLVVLAAYTVLAVAIPTASEVFPRDPVAIPPFLLFNAFLLPGIVPVEPFITVAWSLSYEVFFYLTVPAFISGLHLRSRTPDARRRLLRRWAVATLLLGGLISGTHPRISMFFGGMLLWEWFTHRWPGERDVPGRADRLDRVGLAAFATALTVGLVVPSGLLQGLPRVAVALVAWPVLCAACFGPAGTCHRTAAWTPLRWLGNISYSFYLLHSLVLQGFFLGLQALWEPDGQAGWAWFGLLPVTFALSVAGSLALYLVVEKPLSLDRRGVFRRPGAAPPGG
jgi:peptidoglycan/LPS O-acetylase OafA/YrhL